ncbi:MAG TPA: MBL fold metallo-hydrolase [Gammaproteobacteria bacterium]|nr:MBL fold metallo-hydrolase [Gammaproteobacteria bacterium]
MANRPEVRAFHHEPTSTFSYVVWDPQTRHAAIIDSVLDYSAESGETGTESAAEIVRFVREKDLTVEWILETHAHADHLSAGAYLRRIVGGRTGIGEGIRVVQRHFREVYNLDRGFQADGTPFEHLFADFETFRVGGIEARAIPTPGHTSDHLTYHIGDALFVGDTLFMPDGGTARCDFPGGSAQTLYRSIQRLFELPNETRLFVLHDYRPGGRESRFETTVGEQRRDNIHVGNGRAEQDFVRLRTERDATLGLPTLIIPSVQVNVRGGELPPPEDNGTSYLKVPLNRANGFSQTAR